MTLAECLLDGHELLVGDDLAGIQAFRGLYMARAAYSPAEKVVTAIIMSTSGRGWKERVGDSKQDQGQRLARPVSAGTWDLRRKPVS